MINIIDLFVLVDELRRSRELKLSQRKVTYCK